MLLGGQVEELKRERRKRKHDYGLPHRNCSETAACAAPPRSFLAHECDEAPPFELPTWCSEPDRDILDAEIWRVAPDATSKKWWQPVDAIVLGRRHWFTCGRRHLRGARGGRQPDVELRTARASRQHALLLRNWHGQVFLLDVGSAHGTFLNQERLTPHKPREWRPGAIVYFADKSTEIFELRPSHCNARVKNQSSNVFSPEMSRISLPAHAESTASARGVTAIAAAAAGVGSNFTGARRMMQADFGEELHVRPIARSPPGSTRGPADTTDSVEGQQERSVETTSEIISQAASSFGDCPGVASEAVGHAPQRRSLEERIQLKMLELFGRDPGPRLREWGPRYPCPDNGLQWQLCLWSQRSELFDRARPAVVVVHATVHIKATPYVSVRWVSANICVQNLHVMLTDAPPGINEPGPEGFWRKDFEPGLNEQTVGEASFALQDVHDLPTDYYVRVYSCKSIDFRGIFLGFEFGSTLRPLSAAGDSWTLAGSEAIGM